MTISAMIMSLASLLDFNDCEQLFCLSVYRETPGGVKLGLANNLSGWIVAAKSF
jgi:hypothetical protein